mmetsp:Transcript_12389/g.36462  ORF Transcript_12389/g.36462 Transcript_12389/m.36462 type:complete len:294 (-) Transcript_12389:340-1221(-)
MPNNGPISQLRPDALLHAAHPPPGVLVRIIPSPLLPGGLLGHQLGHQLRFEFGRLVPQPLLRQPPLRIQRRHSAAPAARDRLTVRRIADVPRRKDACDRRSREGVIEFTGQDVPRIIRVEFHHVLKEGRGGRMSDGDEYRVAFDVILFARGDVLQYGAVHDLLGRVACCGSGIVHVDGLAVPLVALVGRHGDELPHDLLHGGVPPHANGGMLNDPLGQNLTRPKLLPTMNDRHAPGRPRQHQRILHGGITPAHDQNVPSSKYRTVARRARAHTSSPQFVLSGHAEPVRFGPGR